MNMNPLGIIFVLLAVFSFWAHTSGRRLKARIERIQKVHGPDARIGYMNKRGKRYIWEITIESVRPKGQDWIITAWCHQKNEFLIFYASQLYEYFDLVRFQEVSNVPAYFTERFGRRKLRKSA